MNFRRILMNAADSSPGSGAPSDVAQSAEPQAQGGAPLTMADVTKLMTDALAQQRNSIFAEMRRNGDTKQPKQHKDDAPATTQPDLGRLRQLDRAIARSPHGAKLSDSQYRRMERAFADEAPEDAGSWLTDYFGETSGAAAPAGAGNSASHPATTSRTGPPASDGGAPAQSQVPIDERRIVGMSQTDVEHLVKTKGARWLRDRLAAELKGTRVSIR